MHSRVMSWEHFSSTGLLHTEQRWLQEVEGGSSCTCGQPQWRFDGGVNLFLLCDGSTLLSSCVGLGEEKCSIRDRPWHLRRSPGHSGGWEISSTYPADRLKPHKINRRYLALNGSQDDSDLNWSFWSAKHHRSAGTSHEKKGQGHCAAAIPNLRSIP